MSLPIDREFVTQALIVLGVCLGGWMVFVKPMAEELAEIDARIEKHVADSATTNLGSIQLVADLAPKLRERCREIDLSNQVAMDSSLLYGRIMEIATANQIKVKNLRPTVEHSTDGNAQMSVTRIDITGEGRYDQIADFFEELNNLGTYIRPVSVQLTPTRRAGDATAVLQLSCEAVQFRLPDAVGQFRKFGNDDA